MSNLPLQEMAEENKHTITQEKTDEIKQREQELVELREVLRLSQVSAFKIQDHLKWLREQDGIITDRWSAHYPFLEQRQRALLDYKERIKDPNDTPEQGPVLQRLQARFEKADTDSLRMEAVLNFCDVTLAFAEINEEAAVKAYTALKAFEMRFAEPIVYHKGNLI
jgi:DNA repair exonuclease SbcCD ATPase subunit